MNEETVRALLEKMAPWVRALALEPVEVSEESVTMRLPFSGAFRHAGGTISAQVYTAAAETAMIVAISAVLGGFQPMNTVAINTQFMHPVRTGDVLVKARVLRMGRYLVFGQVELFNDAGVMAAHATTTHALLN